MIRGSVVSLPGVLALKADADRKVGELHGRLNDCGPTGNRSVSAALDHQMGRSAALAEVIAIMTGEEYESPVALGYERLKVFSVSYRGEYDGEMYKFEDGTTYTGDLWGIR